MTDLSTRNLKRLLAEVAPGPWEYMPGEAADERCIVNLDTTTPCIAIVANNEGSDCTDADLTLAAAAPQLAVEVLWMRLEIGELRNTLARTATECAILDNHEGRLAARIAQSAAETLFRIMQGDPDD